MVADPATPVLWWIKRDIRLADNPALTAALATGRTVIPVFLFEPALLRAEETSGFHVAAWMEALADLRGRLRPHGASVLVLHDDAVSAFARLYEALPFACVYSHEETGSSVTYRRDKAVAQWCEDRGVEWHETMQTGVFRGGINRDQRSQRWRQFMSAGPLPRPAARDLSRVRVPGVFRRMQPPHAEHPTLEAFGHALTADQRELRQAVSETAAEATLFSFLNERGRCYAGGISSPNDAFVCGSRLSVHLAWGTLSGRQALAATESRRRELNQVAGEDAKQWRKSLRSFTSRLHWRDHFMQRLEAEPQMEFEPLNAAYRDLPTPGDDYFDAWFEGRTGWPLVDACMRCARQTGFLNFRMRAMVTSVAVHSLRIDWRKLVHPVAQLWADYEPGIHIAQTQMQAGVVGINQLRVYSPDKQLADHDREATFVRRWVPELRDTPTIDILTHHKNPVSGYPAPLVDWRAQSKSMRADYYAIKRRPETQELADAVYERHGSRRTRRTFKARPTPRKQPGPAPLFGRGPDTA